MKYRRLPIEIESPEQLGYANIRANLAESSVSDLKWNDLHLQLDQLVLAYGDHYGKPELRESIAARYPGIASEDILITAGAANALFIVATSILNKGDRIVVEFPNYSTNLETPAAMGCEVVQIEMRYEDGFRLPLEKVRTAVDRNTKLISVTTPHNPTGSALRIDELRELIAIAERNDCFLLVDETYRDLVFGETLPLAASLSDRVISISSLSKATGLPGLRIGWIVTKNKSLYTKFLAAKEQIIISNSVVDEEIAFQHFAQFNTCLTETVNRVREKLEIVKKWMNNNPHFEWNEPAGGVVGFARLTQQNANTTLFYKRLMDEHATLVGRGAWFGMDDRYMRIGFGWPSAAELTLGLESLYKVAASL